MSVKKSGFINALFPRGLLLRGETIVDIEVRADGLLPLSISWEDELITKIEPIINTSERELKLLLPRLVEPHAHLDKAFTWNDFPNLSGTYNEALSKNLKEHQSRSKEDIRKRLETCIKLATDTLI